MNTYGGYTRESNSDRKGASLAFYRWNSDPYGNPARSRTLSFGLEHLSGIPSTEFYGARRETWTLPWWLEATRAHPLTLVLLMDLPRRTARRCPPYKRGASLTMLWELMVVSTGFEPVNACFEDKVLIQSTRDFMVAGERIELTYWAYETRQFYQN